MGFFTSAFEICLVVTNNNQEETTTEHLLIDYIVVCCYSWMFQPFMTIIRQIIFILYFKLSPCCECCVFLLGDSSASEFYVLTFQNTMSHLHWSCEQELWRWYSMFWNIGTQYLDGEESPKGKNTTNHIELTGESMEGFALISVLKTYSVQ